MIRFFLYIFLAVLIVFNCNNYGYSQSKEIDFEFNYIDKQPDKNISKFIDEFIVKNIFNDSLAILKNYTQLLIKFYELGYLESSIDTIIWNDSVVTAHLFVGKTYNGLKIVDSNLDEKLLNTIGINKTSFENRVFNPGQLVKLSQKVIMHFENSGYPFVQIQLNDIEYKEDRINASLFVDKKAMVTIDSVIVKGNSKINSSYVYNYLNIKPGDIYNESILNKIENRIKELNFIDLEKETQIYFRQNKARVYLYLKDRKVSTVDGILGMQSDRESGKVSLTGEVKLFLSNSFSRGERLNFHWKQPRKLTQNLEVDLVYPYLFSSPFGVNAELEIYKHDTSYLDLEQLIGIQYIFSGNNYLEAFVMYKNSSLLSTENFSNLTQLPDFADISSTNYGLKLNVEKLDYKFNPRKGWIADISFSVGAKSIEKNSRLNEALYDSLLLKSNQYQANIKANYFINIYKRNVLNLGINSAMLIGDNIFSNQLFRIGGLNSIRGFDEESILASTYAILNFEYRYLLEENAYFLLFVNGAFYELEARGNYIKDTPVGFGAGIAFETKLGIFNLNYALGQQFDNPIFFGNAKLHFGIVNYF